MKTVGDHLQEKERAGDKSKYAVGLVVQSVTASSAQIFWEVAVAAYQNRSRDRQVS